MKKIGIIALLLAAILVLSGCELTSSTSSSSGENTSSAESSAESVVEESSSKAEEAIKISAVDLLKAYDENSVKADKDYKDKLLEVTGTVGTIDTDILNSVYVTLKDDEPFSFISVQCYFKDKAEIDKVAELNVDDEVTIIGTCDGQSMNVVLNKCKIK